ncbi:signal peptidase II [Terribacillus sp. DMT04]|nr:signal peptidase II [Terribacillus sp. DMT04]
MMYFIIAIIAVIIDQLTKLAVVKNMTEGESIPIIDNFLYLSSHRNRGAAWGMLEGQFWFFYLVTAIVIVIVSYYIVKYSKESKLMGASLALVLGGAIGNFIDRLFRKEVVDFVDTRFGDYHYPIFNVADSCLVVGVILIIIAMLLDERKKGRKET